MGKFLDYASGSQGNKKTNTEVSKVGNFGKYAANKKKISLEQTIGLDTLQSDLSSMGKTIEGIYGGWQTQETMKNTRSSVESMYNRLNAYQEYQQKFGGADISDIVTGYKSVLDEWDDRTKVYGYYKTADAFNVAKKNAQLGERFKGLTFDQVQEEKKKYKADSDEYKYLDSYTDYANLDDYNKAIDNLTSDKWYALIDGKPSTKVEDISKLHIKDLVNARNVKFELPETYDSYRKYLQNEDFEEKSKYVSTEGKFDNWWDSFTKGQYAMGYADITYEYINNVDGLRDKIKAEKRVYGRDSGNTTTSQEEKGYDNISPDEIAVYNYIYATEGKDKAQEFLDGIEIALSKREYEEDTQRWEKWADSGVVPSTLASLASIPASVFGTIPTTVDALKDAAQGKPYNPYSYNKSLTNFAFDTREYVGENIEESTEGMDVFGQNIPSFLYSTGMSIGDSALGVVSMKGFYAPLAGSNAFHQKAKEMIESGESEDVVYQTAFASGLAEVVFEYISIDKLLKIKNVDSGKKLIKEALKQSGIEMSEEMLTETSNILSDTLIRGNTSELHGMYSDLIERGYTESEANTEIAKEIGSRIGWAGVGGFLSGGAMGSVASANNYSEMSSLGKEIKGNARTEEMIELASLTPKESEAYKAYSMYADKGVNAENIKNAQLGNLYYSTKTDARDVLSSKKTSQEQKAGAIDTLNKLHTIDTDNVEAKKVAQRVSELNTGEVSEETKTGNSFTLEGVKFGKDDTVLITNEGEKSITDVILSENDAELVAYAEGMTEKEANLLISQYDGKSKVSNYVDSFNLVMDYSRLNYTQDMILEHKGVLSEKQVSAIYAETVKATFEEQQNAVKKLSEKYGATLSVQGDFNDSIIDYDNATTDGSKVNWKDLTSTQRSAVRFTQLFSKATGVNVRFIQSEVKDGVHKGKNGSYDPNTNTIEIDVYAGRVDAKVLNDTIIPTLSHEVTHWMKAKSPVIYNNIREEIITTLAKRKNMTSTELVAQELKNNRRVKTEEQAIDELVARGCEDMLSNSNKARKLIAKMSASEQQDFISKVKGTFENLTQWVNDLLSHYKSNSEEAKLLREYKSDLKKISKMWDEMLVSAVEANKALQKEGITGEKLARSVSKSENKTDDVQFCERTNAPNAFNPNGLTLEEQLEEALNTAVPKEGRYVYIGEFTDKFTNMLKEHIVLKDYPIVMNYRDAYLSMESKENGKYKGKNINYHNLGLKGLESALQSFDTPEYVLLSTNESKIELILSGKDYKNRQLFSIVEVNTEAHNDKGFLKAHVVTSVYGNRGIKNRITKAQEEGRLIYNKNEELSQGIPPVQYQGNINDNSSSQDSISQYDTKSQVQNSDRDNLGNALTEGQAEYFKDSKMRDENGNLLVMYRGDMNEFTVFDRKKSKYGNLYGRGFYFTKVKGHAEQYGKAKEYYLNIKNPLSPKQNNITKKQMLNFLKAIENDGEDYDLYNYGEGATAESVLNSVWGKGDFEMIQDINAGAIGDLVAAIELFNEVNGTTYDGIILPSETVTFNSAQSKLTSNENPTDDEDVRFSMRENVEETKELVAVHNMQVSELERTLDLGGLPMPSIAIIKAQTGHSEYGDVSLVFSKETIDPKINKDNKVYGGDAWTPVYPRIEYKPNEKVTQKINDKYYELSRKFGYDESRPLYSYVYEMEDVLNNHKGETALLEDLYDDEKMMQLYLLDSGKDKVETVKKEIRTELSDAEVEMNEFFIRELGSNVVDEIMWDGNGTPFSYRKAYLSKYEDLIRDAYKKLLSEEYNFTEEQVQNVLDSTKSNDLIKMMRDAHKYRENGKVTTRTEVDYEATKKAIKDAAGEDYRDWIDSLFKGIEEKSGIRNNADLFTNSGNRRSWEALHWENNLENVIKVMKSQDNGVAAFFSGQAIWGVSAKDYRSIDEIKADTDRLKQLPEEEYNQIKEGFGERLSEIARSIMDKTEKNHFIAVDNAMECIVDAIRHSKTKSGMFSYLKQFQHLTVTETNVADIVSLVADISNMPTEYFEAKPRRAVELNEIATAIIPDSTSESTKARLDGMGIKYLEYESGNEDARLNALNSLEDVKFSDRDYIETKTKAVMTDARIDYLIEDSGSSSPTYAQKWITSINPTDFINLTTGKWQNREKFDTLPGDYGSNVNEYDYIEGLKNNMRQTPYLAIDEEGQVRGHEGRHRMRALEKKGITSAEIVIEFCFNSGHINKNYNSDGTRLRTVKNTVIENQMGTGQTVEINNIIPLNNDHKAEILECYGEKFATDNDIRFSDRENESIYDKMGETDRLVKENEKLKEDISRLNERLKIEKQITHGNYFNENHLNAVAGHLRKIASSTYSKESLITQLKDVYSYIAQSENLVWDNLYAKCYEVAQNILSEAKPITETDDYAKSILRDIRSKRISLSEAQKQEARYIFGKNYRNSFMGKVMITNDGISLDTQWQEWCHLYPEYFDDSVSEADQINALYDIYDDLKDVSEMVVEYDTEEQTRWLATEIYNQYWNVSPIRTTADKYDKKIKLLNFEHRRAMQELRDSYKERIEKYRDPYNRKMKEKLSEQRKAERERYKELVAKVRERKDREIAEVKQHSKERMDKYKENAERKTVIQSITQKALTLNKWLVKNSKDEHIHEALKEPVINLLQAIDFSSKRLLDKGEPTQKDISLSKALRKVKDMMVDASNGNNDLVELYGHKWNDELTQLVDSVDDAMRKVGDNEFVLNQMTLEQLKVLNGVVGTIKSAVSKMNKFHTVNHAQGIANLSQETILYLDSLGKEKIYTGLRGNAKKLLNWGNALPYYVFKRYGNGGKKVFESFQDGWDKFAFHIKEIMDYANEAYSSKEVKEWTNDIRTFKIVEPATEFDMLDPHYKEKHQEVQMTIPQIMSLYCLQKREQAVSHILGGGLRVADIKVKKGEVISQTDGVVLTIKDIATIIDSLTDKQKLVADKLQRFMNTTCTDWGNEVSMLRFGYKAFGEENYFPIQSDKNNLAVNDETEQNNSLFKLLNMSFTKSTIEKANNRIIISDIFDVFAQHTSDMAKYNALALPVLDAFKWYNYTEKDYKGDETFKTMGVKQSIESAFGKDGQNYFTTFLKDINGQQEVSRDTLGKHFFTNAKIASVGMNIRVALLQPTSYLRASAVINNRYLTMALAHKPKIKMAEKYCGMALWKSMGYYDTNIQKGVEEQIKHDTGWKDKAVDISMKGAEWGDKLTWGYLWNACELEVRRTRKDLKVGSQEFYETIGKRLREIIYATQVVDSTMTRSQMMRSGQMWDKMQTTFGSEPTLAYNMLQDVYMEAKLDSKRMGKKEAFKKHGKKMARVLTAYTATNAIAALVESAFDVFRDDDDEEMDIAEFMKIYLGNFAADMSITAKIPYIKELVSIAQGFTSSRTDTQWMQSLGYAMQGIMKIAEGKGNVHTTGKHLLRTLSYLSGLPFYNAYRDTMATLNKLDIFTAEELEEMLEDFFG